MGLLYALGACFVWGLIFVIPHFLGDFSPIELTLGRYLCYGILSAVLFFRRGTFHLRRYSFKIWGTVLLFALISNMLYYVAVVFGLRYATAPVTVLLLGMCPILVAFYGNWHAREIAFRTLIIPAVCIGIGLILVNVSEIDWKFGGLYTARQYIWGLLAVISAVLGWSLYAVQNARFLKKNSDVARTDWATLIGMGTLFWVIIFGVVLLLWAPQEQLNLSRFTHLSGGTLRFLGGVIILGVVSSWLGCYFWNQASTFLPMSLMGTLIIFETIFSLSLVFLVQLQMPTIWEFVGIAAMLAGIFTFMKSIPKPQPQASPIPIIDNQNQISDSDRSDAEM
ncbi:MAG: Inner membrane protein YtfF [Chlamydiae bacterium]|nr:Inner membrane protein YtfF [Chlamydiota bacterium]